MHQPHGLQELIAAGYPGDVALGVVFQDFLCFFFLCGFFLFPKAPDLRGDGVVGCISLETGESASISWENLRLRGGLPAGA